MKTTNLVFALFVLILTFSACREIKVKTIVNTDGSFTRIITITGDSAEAFKTDLPYPIDSSWAMSVRQDSSDTGKMVVTYTKYFEECGELLSAIKEDTGWMRQLNRRLEINKRFGFFYSYIGYKEVYPAANPFTALPYKEYISLEESQWLTRQKSIKSPSDSSKVKDAEDKVMEYLLESATAEAVNILSEGIKKLNDPELDPAQVLKFRDSINMVLSKWDYKDPGDFIGYYSRWTGDSSVLRLHEIQPPLFADFERKAKFLENVLAMEEFHVDVEMPGLVTGTNSTMLQGNQAGWEVFPMAFLLEDFTITAESRIINVWAFVLSGFFLLGLVVLLVIRSTKK